MGLEDEDFRPSALYLRIEISLPSLSISVISMAHPQECKEPLSGGATYRGLGVWFHKICWASVGRKASKFFILNPTRQKK